MSCDVDAVVILLVLLAWIFGAVRAYFEPSEPPLPPATAAAIAAARRRCETPATGAWLEPLGLSAERRARLPLTAYHEAGHAVLACLHTLDRPLVGVTIVGASPNPGHTEFARASPTSSRGAERERATLAFATVAMAGCYAEQVVGVPLKVAAERARSDVVVAVGLVNTLLRDGWRPSLLSRLRSAERRSDEAVAFVCARTEREILANWRAIDALAGALLEVGTLDGAAATSIVRRALRRPPDGAAEALVADLLRTR